MDSRALTDAGVSEREAEVLALVGERMTNAEISARLYISVRTVESHVSSLLRKLGATDRRALAGLARHPTPPAPSALITGPDGPAAGDRGAPPGPATGPGAAPPGLAELAGTTGTTGTTGLAGTAGTAGTTSSAGVAGTAVESVGGGSSEPGTSLAGNGAPAIRRPALPAPLTSFVGRTAERADLARALDQHRLVTAVGPGGVGKTRLALAVAADVTDRYAQGAWYVDLVPVTDPGALGAAVAAALGFGEQLGRSPTDTVLLRLAGAEALLVLDNCEHVLDAAAELVERLLTACPGVTVLATSQARLSLPYEWAFAVPGLSLAGTDHGDAVTLFLDRAAMVGWSPQGPDDLARVAAICAALDGGALAIELAAARLATRGLDGIEAALGNALGLLTGGPRLDRRHRSLRSALDWSYELLEPVDQAVLRQASVFAAPFTTEAAAAVLADPAPTGLDDVADALARLAGQSLLVVVAAPDGTRYRMLETIRQYGGEQMEQRSEDGTVRGRHLAWCQRTASTLASAPGADRPTTTPTSAATSTVTSAAVSSGPAVRTQGGRNGDDRFDDGFALVADELRAALHWAAAEPGRRSDAHALALLLAELAYGHGRPNESQRHYEQAAALAPGEASTAELLLAAADVALTRLSGDDALRLFRTAAEAALSAGDPRSAALDLLRAAELVDRSSGLLTEQPSPTIIDELVFEARDLAGDDAHVRAAVRMLEAGVGASCDEPPGQPPTGAQPTEKDAEEAVELARKVGDVRLESAALDELTVHQLMRGGIRDGAATARRRIELLAGARAGVPEPRIAYELSDALHMAAQTSIGAGDLAVAQRYAERRHDLPFHRDEDYFVVNWLLVRAALAGDLDDAVALGERLRSGWDRAGRPPLRAFGSAPAAAAMVAGLRGDDDGERAWLDIYVHIARDKGDYRSAYRPLFDAIVALHRGRPDAALAVLADEPETLVQWHLAAWRQWYAALWAEAAVLAERSAGVGAAGAGDTSGPGGPGDTPRGAGAAGNAGNASTAGTDGAGGVPVPVPGGRERIERARALAADNPLALAIVDRATALAAGEPQRLVAIADAFADECPYQRARTLVLAGGPAAEEGRRLMASLHATPMVEP